MAQVIPHAFENDSRVKRIDNQWYLSADLLNQFDQHKIPLRAQRLFLHLLCSTTQDSNRTELTIEHQAYALGISKQTAITANRLLETAGFIQRVRTGRINTTTLLPDKHAAEVSTPDQQEQTQQPLELTPKADNCRQKKLIDVNKLEAKLKEITQKMADTDLKGIERHRLMLKYSEISTLQEKIRSLNTPSVAQAPPLPSPAPDAQQKLEPASREIPFHYRQKIRQRIGKLQQKISAPRLLENEIVFQISQGIFTDKPIDLAINISLKLVREHRWSTPWGFQNRPGANNGSNLFDQKDVSEGSNHPDHYQFGSN